MVPLEAGVKFSTLWSLDFTDEFFLTGLRQWLREYRITHDISHVHKLDVAALPRPKLSSAQRWRAPARAQSHPWRFRRGCMACTTHHRDYLLNPWAYTRAAQPIALVAAMNQVTDARPADPELLDASGIEFRTGAHEESDLTEAQSLASAACTSLPCASPTISAATR